MVTTLAQPAANGHPSRAYAGACSRVSGARPRTFLRPFSARRSALRVWPRVPARPTCQAKPGRFAAGRYLVSFVIEQLAAVGWAQGVDRVEQLQRGAVGREQRTGADIALERPGKIGVDRAGVQRDDDRTIVAALLLARQRAHRHVERGLRRAIAVPAAELVVGKD